MLYAIEWIRESCQRIAGFIERFISNVTLASIGAALTGGWLILLLCVLAGLALCFYGFKCHKLVSGLLGGVELGYIGWLVGAATGSTFITVPILYALVLSIMGFFILYMVYQINVLLVGFLFLHALCTGVLGLSSEHALWAASLGAVVNCILYVRSPKIMSALAGAALLGVIARQLFGDAMGAATCLAAAAGGVVVQFIAKRRYDARLAREEEEQLVKYPYGPGIRDKQKAARQAERSARAQAAGGVSTKEQGVKG